MFPFIGLHLEFVSTFHLPTCFLKFENFHLVHMFTWTQIYNPYILSPEFKLAKNPAYVNKSNNKIGTIYLQHKFKALIVGFGLVCGQSQFALLDPKIQIVEAGWVIILAQSQEKDCLVLLSSVEKVIPIQMNPCKSHILS